MTVKTYEIVLTAEVVAGSFKPEKNVHLLQGDNVLNRLGTVDSPEEVQITSFKSRLVKPDEVRACNIIKGLAKQFPGLVNGDTTDVNGAALVEALSHYLQHWKKGGRLD